MALLGVLLHAGLLVHHALMKFETDDAAALAAAGLMCHGSGVAAAGEDAKSKSPAQSSAGECPFCSAAESFVAIVARQTPDLLAAHAPSVRHQLVAEHIASARAGVRPPPTGPPASFRDLRFGALP